jgi:Domain of unknown function (DUF4183)
MPAEIHVSTGNQHELSVAVTNESAISVSVAGAGVKGDKGDPGVPGTGSASNELVFIATTDGAMLFTLPNVQVSSGTELFINGLSQPRTEYSATPTLLTLPGSLGIMAGDVVSLVYQV